MGSMISFYASKFTEKIRVIEVLDVERVAVSGATHNSHYLA